MSLNGNRVVRTIGGSLVAFFSALLGWFFTQSTKEYSGIYLIMIIIIIIIGGAMASWD